MKVDEILQKVCNEILNRSRFVDANYFCSDPYLDMRSVYYLWKYKFYLRGFKKRCYYSYVKSGGKSQFVYFIKIHDKPTEVHVNILPDGRVGSTTVKGDSGGYVVNLNDTISAVRVLELLKSLPFAVNRFDVEVPEMLIKDPNVDSCQYKLVEEIVRDNGRLLRMNLIY